MLFTLALLVSTSASATPDLDPCATIPALRASPACT